MGRVSNTTITGLVCAILAALTLAAYSPVFGHRFVGYDDPLYVTENARVQAGLNWQTVTWAFTTTEASNWHPLTWLSHALDVQVFGLNAAGHHATNLLLHVINSVLLLLVLRRMTQRLWPSAFVAALFAWHPLHVESVAWVAERKDVLSTFFFLLTLWFYASYAEHQARSPKSRVQRGIRYVSALGVFALGLLSKPMLVTVPCLLLVLDYWPLRRLATTDCAGCARDSVAGIRNSRLSALLLEKLPFLLLAVASSVATFLAQREGGTVSSLQAVPLAARLANAVVSYGQYLLKAIWPVNLAMFYPHRALGGTGGSLPVVWQFAVALLVLVGISAMVVRWRQRRPWLATGWVWYLGTLVPVIGLVQVGSQALADRYTYVPLIGIFVAVTWGLDEWGHRQRSVRPMLVASGVMASFVCVVLTYRQAGYWHDDFALCEHALSVTQNNAPAHAILSNALGRQGRYDLALSHAQAATQADRTHAASWIAQGDAYDRLGQPQEAIRSYQAALQWNPRLPVAWFRLGCVYAALGKLPDAIESYQTAVRHRPDFASAYNNLGSAYWLAGQRPAALRAFAEAVRLSPNSADRHYNLGTALAAESRWAEAAAALARAIQLKPDYLEARTALGGVLVSLGRFSEAQGEFRAVTSLCPTNPEAYLRLGGALLQAGQTNEAATAFTAAHRLQPGLAKAALTAARSMLAQGQLDDALSRLRMVAWMEPGNAEVQEQMGLLLARRGQFAEAIVHLREGLRLVPGAEGAYNLALALAMSGNLLEAVTHYETVLRLKPDSAAALNDLAWIRATAPQAGLRNGTEAIRLARRACELTGDRNPRYLATLDAAYAETGQFAEAIRTAEKARELALAAGEKSVAEAAEARLALYHAGKPHRQ